MAIFSCILGKVCLLLGGMRKVFFLAIFLCFSLTLFAAGNIEVVTEPPGAKVYLEFVGIDPSVDEASLRAQDPRFQEGPGFAGVSPVLVELVGVGRFKVYAEKEGFITATEEAEIFDEQTTKVNISMKSGKRSPVVRENVSSVKMSSSYNIEISLKKQKNSVPIVENLSEIIIKDSSGEKTIIDRFDIKNRMTPSNFRGRSQDTKYYISEMSGEWYVIVQMGDKDSYDLEIKVYDDNKNLIYHDNEKGAYDIVSVHSWELNPTK